MPFCPECRGEFRVDIKMCQACDVELVERLEPLLDGEQELDILCTIYQEENAYIIQGFLENEDIPCAMENISFHAGPAPVGELNKVRLWARTDDLVKARSLLDEHEQFNHCSSCGHVALVNDDQCDFCGEKFNSA